MEPYDAVAVIDNTLASEHPVLLNLKKKIADLEIQLANAVAVKEQTIDTLRTVRQEKWKFEERVKEVLTDALGADNEGIVRQIAEKLDVELTKRYQYEVNVTFQIEMEIDPLNAEAIDPDWDFSFSVDHSNLVDYSSDVVWSKVEEV